MSVVTRLPDNERIRLSSYVQVSMMNLNNPWRCGITVAPGWYGYGTNPHLEIYASASGMRRPGAAGWRFVAASVSPRRSWCGSSRGRDWSRSRRGARSPHSRGRLLTRRVISGHRTEVSRSRWRACLFRHGNPIVRTRQLPIRSGAGSAPRDAGHRGSPDGPDRQDAGLRQTAWGSGYVADIATFFFSRSRKRSTIAHRPMLAT
jgi:hypothetical protein